MAVDTKISWTQATWNIARGCTKVDSDCTYCYMYRESLDGTRYEPKDVVRTKTVFNLPLRLKEPSKIFCSSLTDVFHEAIDPYRFEAFDIMRRCPQHTFQVLTKRPERILYCLELALDHAYKNKLDELAIWLNEWIQGNPPKNIWLGVSVGSNKGRSRIEVLADIPASIRFISFEPLHDEVDMNFDVSTLLAYDWAIIGGESGNENGKYRYRPCQFEWIADIIEWLKPFPIAVWVKQMGTYLAKQHGYKDRHGADISEWPEHLQIQQFPESKV